MRYTEFANFPKPGLTENVLNELNMSPSSLERFLTANADLFVGGFEAECIVSSALTFEPTKDMSVDERINGRTTMDEIFNFFNLEPTDRGWRKMNKEYEEWVESEVNEYISEHLQGEMEELAEKHNYSLDEEDWESPKQFEYEARENLRDEAPNKIDLNLDRFFWQLGNIDHYSEVGDYYNFDWTYISSNDDMTYDRNAAEAQAEELSNNYLGKTVLVNDGYHGRRHSDAYVIEPDGSLDKGREDDEDMGMEIISYPMPLEEMMDDLESVFRYIDHNCYTNDSTGLHINLSFKDGSVADIDYMKLILFLGDDQVLSDFERTANEYTQSSFAYLSNKTAKLRNAIPSDIARSFDLMKQGLMKEAGKIIADTSAGKYFSVNMKGSYIEFRSMGGDYITKWHSIKNGVMRFAQAMAIAADPNAERKEYALKLYKFLAKDNPQEFRDAIQAFSLYNGDLISRDALLTYLKNKRAK